MAQWGLDRRVRRSLEEVVALHHDVGRGHQLVHLTELEVDPLGHVSVSPVLLRIVDERAPLVPGCREGIGRIEVGVELLVFDVDEAQRLRGGVLVDRGDGGDPVPHVTDPVHAERILVRRPRNDAVANGHVLAGDHRMYAVQRFSARGVDGQDACMRVWATQNLAVQHPGQGDVVRVRRPSGRFGETVDLPLWLSDQREVGL